jgi:peroxiredoxin
MLPFTFVSRSFYLAALERVKDQADFSSIVSDILIISNADLFFKKAWNNRWQDTDRETVELLCAYGVDFEKYVRKYDIAVY